MINRDLATRNSHSKNVLVISIVVTELELGDVKRKILAADFMECSNHPALNERPEALDGLSMNRTDNVLADGVVNSGVIKFPVQIFVASPLIGAKQTDFRGNTLTHKLGKGRGLHVINDAGDHVALTTNSADDDSLTHATSSAASVAALVLVPVLGLSANESFVHFDNAHEFAEVLVNQSSSDAVAHMPSGAIGTEAKHPVNLQRTNPLLTGEHQMDDAEPVPQGLVRILEDRPGDVREAVAIIGAFFTLPMPFTGRQIVNSLVAAARADHAIGPAVCDQIRRASILIWESLFPFGYCHLVDALFAVLRHLAFSRQYVGRIPC